jgi:hypothetical protein
MKDRLLKNPITTVIGVLLIALALYIVKLDESETVTLTLGALFGGAGLIALGLKDPKNEDNDVA